MGQNGPIFFTLDKKFGILEIMQDDLAPKKEKDIDDLIKLSQEGKGKVKISSEDVEEKLKDKIREIEEKRKEMAALQEAEELGINHISLKGFPINPDALILLTEEEAKRFKAVCFFKTDREMRLGAVEPNSSELIGLLKKLEKENRVTGELYKISEYSLEQALALYKAIPKPRKFVEGIEISEADLKSFQKGITTYKDISAKLQHVSTTEILTVIIAGGVQASVSDIHIEAEKENIKIRYRIDGLLYDIATIPKKDWQKIVNRVKLISKLKINVTDIPQDGRFTIYLTNEFIDVRVSTVPSAYGESIVMRLLMSSATGLELEDIGLVGFAYDVMKKEIERPNGMILTTGPTGSGKTTTLYSILKKLNKPESKIITLENPIEYRIEGITQSQVESSEEAEGQKQDIREMLASGSGTKKHFTYASGLRAVLRQDPDIVMVGEIRDHETAEIAIQAALTGHLMLSTLHTNSAAGAIPRLLSMEVKTFLLAPSLNVIIGQRLVRKVCSECKEEYAPSKEVIKKVEKVIDSIPVEKKTDIVKENFKFYKGKGCQKCSDIGYKGRVGIFEILTMNEEIEKLILTGQVSEYQIQDIAKRHGMLTMLQDGIIKAVQGITSPEEVFREID